MGSPSTGTPDQKREMPGSFPKSFEAQPLDPNRPTSVGEAKRRVRDLEREVNLAKARAGPRLTNGIFKAACSTDLLFLIDTTYSMQSYIDSAKEQVKDIVADVQKYFFGEAQMRVSVVSYRDHTDKVNVQFKDFTTSTAEIYSFLDGLEARGGADAPEDVLGGIQQALHASWNQQTRCIVHIADAPPHGQSLHDFDADDDSYYATGSEPHRLVYAPLIQAMVKIQVNYGLLRINSSTDRMSFVFSQIYAAAGGSTRLLENNKYYLQGPNKSLANARLQFEEMNLGASLADVRRLVVRMVTNSVSSSATRIADAMEQGSLGKSTHTRTTRLGGLLSMIREDHRGHDACEDIILDKSEPQWHTEGWFDKIWHVQGYCPDVVHNARTLTLMITSDASIKLSYAELTVHARSVPFGKGGVRTACYAQTAASKSPFVLKSFIKQGQSKAALIEEMRMQALCKSFALEFNSMLKLDKPIDFVVTTCVQPKSHATSEDEHMFLEPYIPGEYIKYNGNNGYLHGDESHPFFDVAQAFSHYTFERSWGQMLVDDLQGVDNILTDPAVQTKDPKRFNLSLTNFHTDGFKFWFSSHTCNAICRQLGLKSTGAMLLSNNFEFRETWPFMEPTTCCSSKLCRRIIALADAKTISDLPGFQWCHECWVQLMMESRPCSVSGPHHTFDISDFFHESQGQLSPTQCPRHRERDTSEASTAAVGGRLFSSMLAASSTTSFIDGRIW